MRNIKKQKKEEDEKKKPKKKRRKEETKRMYLRNVQAQIIDPTGYPLHAALKPQNTDNNLGFWSHHRALLVKRTIDALMAISLTESAPFGVIDNSGGLASNRVH